MRNPSTGSVGSRPTPAPPPRQLRESVAAARGRRKLETAALWVRVTSSRSGEESERLREEIVLLNMSVAEAIACRYAGRGISLDDLEQVAYLGLLKAVHGFDPAFQKDFLSYAVPTISGEVKRHFRDFGWTVRPPRRVQELQARIQSSSDDPAQALGRAARPPEIAAHLGVDVSDVIEALTCNGFSPMSLDVPLGEPGSSASLGDLLACGRDDYVDVEDAMLLAGAIRSLSERDLLILRRRFIEDWTQQQIGDEIGISQMQVSRLLARILERLRALVAATDADMDLSA